VIHVFFNLVMLIDYWQPILAAIATGSGLASLVVNTHVKGHRPAKWILPAVACIGAVAMLGGTFYQQHQIIAARDADARRARDEMQRRTEIRTQLSRFIDEGTQLMRLCADTNAPIPAQEADKWGNRIESFVRMRLGESYVSRKKNPGPLPTTPIANDKDRTALFRSVYSVNGYLEEFSREFSP
jgi:hypothetical protein